MVEEVEEIEKTKEVGKLSDKLIVRVLSVERFLLGFVSAFGAYVLSTYFAQVIGSDEVSIFFLIASVMTLILLLNLHHLIARVGRARLLLGVFVAVITILALLIAQGVSQVGAGLLIAYMILMTIVAVLLSMIMEAYASDANAGHMHGAQLTLMNMGFICGPFVAMEVITRYDFGGLFFVMLVVYSIMFVVALVGVSHIARLNHITHDSAPTLLQHALARPWMRKIYTAVVSLQFFYAIMAIYVPLYFRELGYEWDRIGLILTIALVPFILIEYPAGVVADRWLGERELLIAGFVIVLGATLAMAVVAGGIWWWAGVLFVSRIGAALIEAMTDIYFFKHVDGDNVGLMDVYRTASSTGYLVAMFIVGGMLTLIADDLRLTFLAAAAALSVGLVSAWRMTDTTIKD